MSGNRIGRCHRCHMCTYVTYDIIVCPAPLGWSPTPDLQRVSAARDHGSGSKGTQPADSQCLDWPPKQSKPPLMAPVPLSGQAISTLSSTQTLTPVRVRTGGEKTKLLPSGNETQAQALVVDSHRHLQPQRRDFTHIYHAPSPGGSRLDHIYVNQPANDADRLPDSCHLPQVPLTHHRTHAPDRLQPSTCLLPRQTEARGPGDRQVRLALAAHEGLAVSMEACVDGARPSVRRHRPRQSILEVSTLGVLHTRQPWKSPERGTENAAPAPGARDQARMGAGGPPRATAGAGS
jgi:hypothetical protein